MATFSNLLTHPLLLQRLAQLKYESPTPIQLAAIPLVLAGKDLMAAAPTGTGKTAAFVLPVLQLMAQHPRPLNEYDKALPRVLVIAPTRELAQQLEASLNQYGKLTDQKVLMLCGGQDNARQRQDALKGCDIVVATPGRLYELMNNRILDFDALQCLILDEADRLLDMGFADDLQLIIKRLPATRQNLMFSATSSEPVRELAAMIMPNATALGQAQANRTSIDVKQWLVPVDHTDKGNATITLLRENKWSQVLIFTKTKAGADVLLEQLKEEGFKAEALHGDKHQSERNRILNAFKTHKLPILVATDIAARGLDIANLPAVVNHDLPPVAEDYIHRIGRTGRAGEKGVAISLVAAHEIDTLSEIEQLIGRILPRKDLIGHVPNHRVPDSAPKSRKRKEEQPLGKKANKRRSNKATPPRNTGTGERKKAGGDRSAENNGNSLFAGRKNITKRSID
ncbi:DEAD/DEAH box helicase [Thalassolituus oleivorans]|uniref:DEAD/DEAH box helicase n=1 Tax=Thalassolituus oleivorans TaxID=187493 RepID=UPI0023F41FAF|nr:DEAD/DEAH box helicase [Thalassolituus oleivorans]